MLSPEELQDIADSLVEIYENIEDDLLKNIAGRLSVLDEITPDTAAEWQTKKLLQLGALRKENLALIAKHSGKAEKDIERILREAGYKALSFDEQIYQQAFAAGLLGAAPLPVHSSIDIQRLLTAAINNAKQALNLINTTALESANQEFLKVINQVYLETSLGISDYNTAMRKAVRGLSDMGITGANYVSERGKRTRNHIDVAVKRAVNTSAFQTAAKMQIQRANEWGSNLVEVTSHMGARPSHAAWQGRVYSLVGSTAVYPNLTDSTGYGTVTGLCGANCKHHFYPYFEGISERAYEPYGKKENQKVYEESQQQRQLERDIRKQKRRALTAEASGDAEGLLDAQLKLRAKETELKDFLKKTGRTRRGNRQQVLDFSRPQASKAVWAKRKADNPSSFPSDMFKRNLSHNRVTDPSYASTLNKRFDSGSATAKKVFSKYVPNNSIESGTYPHVPHYSPSTKRISMNFADDSHNPRGVGSIYFHEHGHLIDYATGSPVSAKSATFKEALHKDYNQYIIDYMGKHGIGNIDIAYRAISDDLKKTDLLSAVSDIMGGISGGNVQGRWGHRPSYWGNDPNTIAIESFAHLFEAQFSAERLRLFSIYFPTATKEFELILEGLL